MSRLPGTQATHTAIRWNFDGFGINDKQDAYCARVATFTKHGLSCTPSAQNLTDRLNVYEAMKAALLESAKQHRSRGDKAHAVMCEAALQGVEP